MAVQQVMIPGLKTCPNGAGSRPEYTGWLATLSGRSSAQPICVKSDTDFSGSGLQRLLFSSCPSYARDDCSGYPQGQPIPCAVCLV